MCSVSPTLSASVAAEVRALMARNRCRVAVLAQTLDLSRDATSKRLRGVVPFSLDELAAIAEFFGVTVHDLLPDSVPVASAS